MVLPMRSNAPRLRFRASLLLLAATLAAMFAACSPASKPTAFDPGGAGGTGTTTATTAGGGIGGTSPSSTAGVGGDLTVGAGGGSSCDISCSPDFHSVVDCNGQVVKTCSGAEGCDLATATCKNACSSAVSNKQSVGCEYYATFMDAFNPNACFAAFVANTWNTPVHISVDYAGQSLPINTFAFVPSGSGPNLTYSPVNPVTGLPPGEVAIVFLSGPTGPPGSGVAPCPKPSAVPSGVILANQTGIGHSFHITSDVPVVAYQMNPYGGGSAAVTGASLLLPTSAWDVNYIAVSAAPYDIANPSMNIVATENDTHVTMLPTGHVLGGGGVPSGQANQPMVISLNRGDHAQITQQGDLTGSVLQADKPIGFMAGQQCMRAPFGVAYCDHGEQMIPPIKALGSEYVGVMYRPRVGEPAIWHVVGALDGTQLTWSSNVGGPSTLNRGQVAEFITSDPFVVKSQDDMHPFMLFTYMSGSQWKPGLDGYGDADFVISVPPQQYMSQYVFFADPTYPETNLVIVRAKDKNGMFHDVNLDCLGNVQGFQAIGDYEWARVDLITGNFQNVGNCSTGRHEIKSDAHFGLWIWGWGTPLTQIFTSNVSYGYPAGMNVQPINTIVVPPTPK
jgi:hypothetical protein